VAQHGSKITNVNIDIAKEKRKSFWNGFSFGSIIASLIACAIWYFFLRIIEQ
jgi:alpha/beta superfamily hydrolase